LTFIPVLSAVLIFLISVFGIIFRWQGRRVGCRFVGGRDAARCVAGIDNI